MHLYPARHCFMAQKEINRDIHVQVIKTFSKQEGWLNVGIKGDGGIKSKGTRLLIEKEK